MLRLEAEAVEPSPEPWVATQAAAYLGTPTRAEWAGCRPRQWAVAAAKAVMTAQPPEGKAAVALVHPPRERVEHRRPGSGAPVTMTVTAPESAMATTV